MECSSRCGVRGMTWGREAVLVAVVPGASASRARLLFQAPPETEMLKGLQRIYV